MLGHGMRDELEPYLAGEKLWGDDFSREQIEAWYEDEREGYANLGAADRATYAYPYHALNRRWGFDLLPAGRLGRALGIGSAYGDEFEPILDRLDEIVIVEPSAALRPVQLGGIPITAVEPNASGALPFPDSRFDIATLFSVLHHIPNVSFVVRELYRCVRSGGHVLIREPIISMGDWRNPRHGLTRRERGIPLRLLRDVLRAAGFKIEHERLVGFPLIPRLSKLVGIKDPYNHDAFVTLDALAVQAVRWNLRYHARSALQKIRPTSVFLVVTR